MNITEHRYANFRFKCLVLSLVIGLLYVSCKQVNNKKATLILGNNTTDSLHAKKSDVNYKCELNSNNKLYSNTNSNNLLIEIKGLTIDQKINVKLNELNFVNNELSDVNVTCNKNSFNVEYKESLGNNSYSTIHVFEYDSLYKKYNWTKIYKTKSTRQGFSIKGALIKDQKNNYTGKEDLKLESIYTFRGFQEGKEPIIDSFYKLIKSNNNLELTSNPYVLDYLINEIGISIDNVSSYNSITRILEKHDLNGEAIFVLEHIIKQIPNEEIAYLKLGNLYWKTGATKNANKNYKKYVDFMQKLDKKSSVPSYVFERLN